MEPVPALPFIKLFRVESEQINELRYSSQSVRRVLRPSHWASLIGFARNLPCCGLYEFVIQPVSQSKLIEEREVVAEARFLSQLRNSFDATNVTRKGSFRQCDPCIPHVPTVNTKQDFGRNLYFFAIVIVNSSFPVNNLSSHNINNSLNN